MWLVTCCTESGMKDHSPLHLIQRHIEELMICSSLPLDRKDLLLLSFTGSFFHSLSTFLSPFCGKIFFLICLFSTFSLSLMQISLLCRENIYYQDSAESVPKLIASSPDETTVMNGIPDWLYEEEILSKESAMWFSPEGTRLLYASFNDSGVDITNYPLYGNYEDNLNTSPELMAVRYPKVRFLPTLSLPFSHQFFPLVHTSYICPKSFRCDFEINSTWICLSN